MSRAPLVRALTTQDVVAAVELSAAAFGFELDDETARGRWEERVRHLLGSDPDGAFAAELDGRLVGVAQAMRRERLWCLSLLTVLPEAQSCGAGRALLARALDYGSPADPGLIVSSNDPRAMRLYGLAGFALQPTLETDGSVDRRSLPAPDGRVREAGAADLEFVDSICREVRGGPHAPELELALRQGVVLLRLADSGFAATMPDHGAWLLAAREPIAARTLLWHALEAAGETTGRPAVRWITGAQRWAIETVLAAGLRLTAYGALAVRGAPGPLHPYLPSGPFA